MKNVIRIAVVLGALGGKPLVPGANRRQYCWLPRRPRRDACLERRRAPDRKAPGLERRGTGAALMRHMAARVACVDHG
jgi:hypothetical protein